MPRAPIPRARRRSDHSQPRSPGQNKSTRAVQTPGGFLVPPRARRSPGGKRARPSQNLARCETRLQSSITVSTTEHYTGTFGHDGYSYDNDIPQRSGSSYPPERSCNSRPPGGNLFLHMAPAHVSNLDRSFTHNNTAQGIWQPSSTALPTTTRYLPSANQRAAGQWLHPPEAAS